jgi:hypothetical protein
MRAAAVHFTYNRDSSVSLRSRGRTMARYHQTTYSNPAADAERFLAGFFGTEDQSKWRVIYHFSKASGGAA